MKQPKSFEEGMDRLQGLLGQLQDESTPLADSVKLYAEAAGLIHYCNTALDKAKAAGRGDRRQPAPGGRYPMKHEDYKQQFTAWAQLTEARLAELCDTYLPQQSALGQAARYSLWAAANGYAPY